MQEDKEWQEIDGKLTNEFVFRDFNAALAFVNRVGELAEEAKHHPDIFVYDYNHVMIQLFTHDEDAITSKDENLAAQIDRVV